MEHKSEILTEVRRWTANHLTYVVHHWNVFH